MSEQINEIEKLAELRDRGILTDEEFQQKKTKLLSDDASTSDNDLTAAVGPATERDSTGWSKKAFWGYVGLSVLIPIAGFVVGIVAMTKGGRKVRQGVVLIVVSVAVALLFLAAVGGGGTSQSAAVQMVQTGTLEGYPAKTLGEAVDGFLNSPSWEAITANDGNTYVNISGRTSFMDATVDVLLQYRVDTETGEFELQAFEMNDVPQNTMMYAGLLAAMYE